MEKPYRFWKRPWFWKRPGLKEPKKTSSLEKLLAAMAQGDWEDWEDWEGLGRIEEDWGGLERIGED